MNSLTSWQISLSAASVNRQFVSSTMATFGAVFFELISLRASSRTPGRASARIALEARAVPHQGEVEALAAHLAFVAARLGLLAPLGRDQLRVGAGFRARQLELLGWRE